MIFTTIVAALLLWIVIGGIVAILVCPLLQDPTGNPETQIEKQESAATDQASVSSLDFEFPEYGHKPFSAGRRTPG